MCITMKVLRAISSLKCSWNFFLQFSSLENAQASLGMEERNWNMIDKRLDENPLNSPPRVC